MSVNIPGINAAGLRPYMSLHLGSMNPAPAAPAAPAATLPAFPLPVVPLFAAAALPLPSPAASALPAAPALPLPAVPDHPLPAGNDAPAAVAAPVEEQPVPLWPNSPKPISGRHQALTVWPSTSNKDPLQYYVQGNYVLLPGGEDVVGSLAWLLRRHPGARGESVAKFFVCLLGRNGWTNKRVLADAYTRMYMDGVKKFTGLVVGSAEYAEQWKKADNLVRQTLSKKEYNDLFINEGDAGIVGGQATGGDCLWRLRRPEDPPKPEPAKGKRDKRPRADGDEDDPTDDREPAPGERDGSPVGGPAAKMRRGASAGG
ncbi:hypothetical protein EAE96_008450 [Botrytis aclada]|nr:hypothetical protein EAE96_008450 [Botrytis aclada]